MTETPWLDDRRQHVWRLWLHATSRLPGALSTQLHVDSGLSLADFSVLVHLSEEPQQRCRIAALADALRWERSRLSHQLTRMQKRGLIAREECSEDGRGAFAVLTVAGRERVEQAAPGHVRRVRQLFFDDVDEDDLPVLERLLTRLVHRLDAEEGAAPL